MQQLQTQPTILQKIVQDKAIWVAQKQQAFPLSEFQAKITKSERNFYAAMSVKKLRRQRV